MAVKRMAKRWRSAFCLAATLILVQLFTVTAFAAEASALIGVDWKVESVEGKAILPNSTVTIRFNDDGRISGKALNNYMAAWIDVGDRILIGRVASTMMAGAPELMEQEGQFLDALDGVRRFEIRSGMLVLITKNGGEIVATR